MKQSIIIFAFLFLLSGIVLATEKRTVSGTVSDNEGNLLSGIKVTVEKTSRGTVSNINGFYKIEVLPNDKHLTFSGIGMKTQKVKIAGKSTLNVTMRYEDKLLEESIVLDEEECAEVQVVAYGIHPKRNKCAGIATVQAAGSNKNMFYMQSPEWNTENYSTIHENGFKDAKTNPLSTFSVDVDNASYSNVRRFINSGNLPPVDAVRIEEMINYFSYNYPEPKGEHPFSVTTELAQCPWNSDNCLMHVGLKGRSIDKERLPASNLVLLLDVSGSMNSPDKLPLLKRAFSMLVNELRPTDRVAIVVYAGAAGEVLESTAGNKKTEILDALQRLSAGGSTAGGAGLKLAYKIAGENFVKGGNNRVILATDGDFNVGVSSTSEMERLVEKERKKGVFMTVLGFGTGNIKDDKMETIADKGNGNYAYIDNIQEARKVFISEFGGTLFTIAKDVKFQLEFNPEHVKSYRLVGYENRLLNDEDFNDDKKDAGEIGAGHTVTALYEIVPANSNAETPLVDKLKYQSWSPNANNNLYGELLTIKLRYKQPDGKKSKLIEVPVKNKLAANSSDDFRFSAAVASFGMLLRNSGYVKNIDLASVVKLAKDAKGDDDEGYRSEFIRLAKTVDDLHLLPDNESSENKE